MSTRIYCLLFVLILAGRSGADDGPVEPYVVYVARDGEFARCGPSQDYYKTDPLRAGTEVEVYLETDDGWLGIRPPADSFCWLQSDQVDVAEDESTGTVIEPATVAWIGTHLGKARQYRWQVRLDQGEEVTIIGTARREGPEGDEIWYRIVPPPGEFRWVQRSQVREMLEDVAFSESSQPTQRVADSHRDTRQRPQPHHSPADSARDRAAGGETTGPEAKAVARRDETPEDVSADAQELAATDDTPVGSGVAATRQSRRAVESRVRLENDVQIRGIAEHHAPAPPDEEAAAGGRAWVSGSRVVTASANEPVEQPLRATAPPSLEPIGSAALGPSGYRPPSDMSGADVEQLRLELARAMAAGARSGETDPLRDRAAELAEKGDNSVERGRATLLLRRVEQYQRMALQRDGQHGESVGNSGDLALAAVTEPSASRLAAPESAAGAASFDRQGWLVRVYSARPDAPPYAITDSAGRTLSYVTPVPGVNLRRYLNQEIGLYGRVAYDTSLETPHLIAEQAVRMRR